MRSWSKWVNFSSRTMSCSSVGPRAPACSELWLSGITTPLPVVRKFSVSWLKVSSCLCLAEAPSDGLDLRVASGLDWAMKRGLLWPAPGGASRFLFGSGLEVERGFDGVDHQRERDGAGARCGAPHQPFRYRGDEVHGALLAGGGTTRPRPSSLGSSWG